MEIQIVDKSTGELFPITTRKKEMADFVSGLDDKSKISYLNKANYLRRVISALEGELKDYMKENTEIDDSTGQGNFGDVRISRINSRRFSESKLMREGSEIEVEQWEALKKKYSVTTTFLKI